MPYTGLCWHSVERTGQFNSKPRDSKCKFDDLLKYLSNLVEYVAYSIPVEIRVMGSS